MNEILLNTVALVLLVAGFVALVRFARTDTFAGPGLGHRDLDELNRLNELSAPVLD